MRKHAAVLLCSVLCSVLCSGVPAEETKALVGRAFFVVDEPAAAPSVPLPAATSRDGSADLATEADLLAASTGYHKSHRSDAHKGKKGGKKTYKSGYIKGHDHKGKKGYHKNDHHEKHSFGDYAEGHHSKHKGDGGKDYKGSEHKEKHKGGYKKGDVGAKGKKFGHKGKYHKGHHDKGFKHKEDHDAHGHKHDDQHKKVTGKYGSSYEEEEGYYKKGKGKHHKGGKFAGGKTWDYKGGDSFSISGKYHDDYSDVKGKYGYHGEELHKHKKGAKGGHKSGKSHKKGDAHKGHPGHDHKGHHSHYAPVHHSVPAHDEVSRQGVAYSAPVTTQKRSHSSPSHSKNLAGESTVDASPRKSRQYRINSPRHLKNSQSKTIHRNQHQPQHSHLHPRKQRHGKPQNLDHSPPHDPESRNKHFLNQPHDSPRPNPKYPHRAPPPRQGPAKQQYVTPNPNPLFAPNANPQSQYNPHNSRNPRAKLRHRTVPPNGRPQKSPPRRQHPNSIRSESHENDRSRLKVQHPEPIAGTLYNKENVHGSHSIPLYTPQVPRDSALRSHSQSAAHPQHSHPPPPPPANHGSYSQPEIAVPQNSKPDRPELSTQRYSRPHRGPKRGYGQRRPKQYEKPLVYENEVVDEAPNETYRDDNPYHSEDQHDGGSESSRDKEYSYYERENPRYEKQEDNRRENRIREDDKYNKNSKHSKSHEYEDDRSTHETPYQRRPPPHQHDDSDEHSQPEHEAQDDRKQYYDERRYPAENNNRGYNSNEDEDSKPSYENRQQVIDKPRYADREAPREKNEDSDGAPRHHNYQPHNRGHPRAYPRQTSNGQRQAEPADRDPAHTPDQSQHQYREKDHPSGEEEQKTSVTQQSGGAQNKNQQSGFYFPTLGHPLGFSNFAAGASNVPSVGTHKKLEPAASVFSLGHSQFSFDTFGDFGKFMPHPHNNKRQ